MLKLQTKDCNDISCTFLVTREIYDLAREGKCCNVIISQAQLVSSVNYNLISLIN